MEKIDSSQLKQLIERERIDFISYAYTPWHVIGNDAIISYLNDTYGSIKGVSLICRHPDTGYCIDESHFKNNCSKIFKFEESNTKSIKDIFGLLRYIFVDHKSEPNKRPLFFISMNPSSYLASYCYFKKKNIHAVFFRRDEGVGGYMNTVERTLEPFSFSRTYFKNLLGFLLNKKLAIDVISRNHEVHDMGLFHRSEKGLTVNNIIIPYYRSRFLQDNLNAIEYLPLDSNKPFVLICTTAWQRNLIKEEDDLRVLKAVTNVFVKKGYQILLKTHPRDIYWESKAKVLNAMVIRNSSCSFENIMCSIKPSAVVSFSSTVLVTAKLFWDAPAFCLTDLLNRDFIGEKYIREIDGFKRVFANHVFFVENIEILRKSIEPAI